MTSRAEAFGRAAMHLLKSGVEDPRRLSHLGRWLCSRLPWHTALRDAEPWVTYLARDWLERALDHSARVFEFGSGGSTLYLARRAGSLVAVEHDPDWAQAVSAALPPGVDVQIIVVPPEGVGDGGPLNHGDPTEAVTEHAFEGYASAIDAFPDEWFDLVIIDGRARCACARHAVSKVRQGGHVLLDNAERPAYRPIHELLAGYEKAIYPGPWPYSSCIGETVVWRISDLRDA